jgi:hypothetical protein
VSGQIGGKNRSQDVDHDDEASQHNERMLAQLDQELNQVAAQDPQPDTPGIAQAG